VVSPDSDRDIHRDRGPRPSTATNAERVVDVVTSMPVVQIQAPAATLSWAVLDQQIDWALAQLGTARDAAEPGDLLP
jgi:hypothetical protein